MWRNEEENAIRIGLSLDYFWSLTPKQYTKHIRVFNEQEKNRVQEQDKLNHILASYIGFAIKDPKHFPKNPVLSETQSKTLKVMTDDEMERQARLNTIKKGGVIK